MYGLHFVNNLANHFSHLAFRCSHQTVGIFTKRRRRDRESFSSRFSQINDERNRRYCEKSKVIGSQSHEVVHEIVHEHVEMRETKVYSQLKLLKEVYDENSLSCACIFKWYKLFSEGQESTEND